jgi:hypothetical protein
MFGEQFKVSGDKIELFLGPYALISALLTATVCKPVSSMVSSSERNSRLLSAVLNISSVIEEPLVFRGELAP